VVYIATAEGQIYPRNPGDCDRGPANRGFVYQFTGGVSATPVIVGDLLIVPNGPSLVAIDLNNNDPEAFEWIFHSGALIQSAPVVAGDTVYFGNNAGTVYAIALDPDDPAGEVYWTWQTDNAVVSSMAVLDGIVFVTGTDGVVYAIGGSAERSAVSGGATTTTMAGITTTTDPDATTTTREPVVTTIIPPTGVGGAQ
jgi:outer membrane protein assembly factor BamB